MKSESHSSDGAILGRKIRRMTGLGLYKDAAWLVAIRALQLDKWHHRLMCSLGNTKKKRGDRFAGLVEARLMTPRMTAD